MSEQTISVGRLSCGIGGRPGVGAISVDGVDILDAIHLTVRDDGWNTIEPERQEHELAVSAGGFDLREHWIGRWDAHRVDLRLHVRATAAELTVRCEITTPARTAVNRVGLCILHPLSLAGAPVVLRTPAGELADVFPVAVSPHQPFRDLTGMRLRTPSGADVSIDFHGGVFETEDHRNWTDPGWKTYTPPLADGFPFVLDPASPSVQEVVIRVGAEPDAAKPPRAAPPSATGVITVVADSLARLPRIGFGAASDAVPPGAPAPAFLSVEVADSPQGQDRLARALNQAGALGIPVRVTLTAGADALDRWAARLSASAIEAVCVVDPLTQCSSAGVTERLRALLGRGIRIAGGTRGYLAEYGRSEEPVDTGDEVQLSLSPEVHYVDDDWLFRTQAAYPAWLAAVRRRAGGRPITVSPITLAQRLTLHGSDPDACGPWDAAYPEDPRAGEEFAAAWVLGVIAGLPGIAAASFFDLTDGRGIVSDGAPTPAGALLSRLARHAGAPMHALSGAPVAAVTGFGLASATGMQALVGNRSGSAREVVVRVDDHEHDLLLPPYAVLVVHGSDVRPATAGSFTSQA